MLTLSGGLSSARTGEIEYKLKAATNAYGASFLIDK
jgi:hypothetical protein